MNTSPTVDQEKVGARKGRRLSSPGRVWRLRAGGAFRRLNALSR